MIPAFPLWLSLMYCNCCLCLFLYTHTACQAVIWWAEPRSDGLTHIPAVRCWCETGATWPSFHCCSVFSSSTIFPLLKNKSQCIMCFPPQLGYIYRDILTAKCCNNWSLYFPSIWMWSQSLFLHKLSLKPLSPKVHFGAFICYVNVLMRSSFHSKALPCTYQSRFVHVDQNMTVWHLWAQAHWGACPLFLNEPWCSDCLSFFLRVTIDWVNVFTGIRWKFKDQARDFILSWLPEFFTVYQDVALSNLCWYNSKWYLKKEKEKSLYI